MSSATSTAATGTPSSSAAPTLQASSNLKVVGIILAIASGLLIGSSFVFKKKGLLRSQAGHAAGEGVGYLKSPLWWLGMSMMILGELCNFAAYAFVEAIVVTPLGALSVVVCAILSSLFLNEKLSFFGWLGCGLCIIGSVIIALNGDHNRVSVQLPSLTLPQAQRKRLLSRLRIDTHCHILGHYILLCPRYGKKSMLWYIFVCSMIGGISVSVTTGLGAAIVTTAMGENQFKFWFMYFLLGFVIVTLVTEVYYLNVALALFNTAMVTPTYYVIFTFFSMLTTVVLFKGLHASADQIITIVMAFLVICVGITILQMSKVDPVQLSKLDRRSTILLQAARSQTSTMEEKGAVGIEDPGMDALRGSFGTVGSIIRARSARRMSQSSQFRPRPSGAAAPYDPESMHPWSPAAGDGNLAGLKRHQLYDAPVPRDDVSTLSSPSINSQKMNKRPTIKFDSQDVVHQYNPPGTGDDRATHEHRTALGSPAVASRTDGYPPTPSRAQADDKAKLVDLDSAAPSVGGSGTQQTLVLPPIRTLDPEIRSAPPSMPSRFARPGGPGRKDSRDIFEDSPTSGTLLSFPSVTDSARSWDGDSSERDRDSVRTVKRYPKGDGDDDRDESVGLWKGTTTDSDEEPPAGSGGIRLVQPRF
ncbi:magnesium transporter NIPA-domain-containing protein [Infundibulicybe gibba]|nr:magnesium transporter NIPA-domain-containing protein [Infundibulicybe gibba]